ncbi:MAG TPA: chemotaxis protein CheB [Gemmatimonadales bacterium]|jgi:two-component system chemotaxis response regulator CheB|nr:chemotaxis protein CheB [Gemmatimonadales bacterium]
MAARDMIVIGGSAGAIEAVSKVVSDLPADLPASVFVVIHFPTDSVSVLPRILERAGRLPAHHPADQETIRHGQIYVAPPDYHLNIQDGVVRCRRGPKENGVRPAIDPLFRTAAEARGPRVIGVILSGNLTDGTAGLQAIKRRGGVTIAQDPQGLIYQSMPRSAIENVPVDHICPVEDIGPALLELVRTPVQEVPTMPAADEVHAAERDAVARDRTRNDGIPSTYTCPECHGTLWEVEDGDVLGFRCRVGHAYSADALYSHQDDGVEAALWTALRSLEEHTALCRRLAAKARDRGRPRSDTLFTEKAIEAEGHARVLRQAVLAAGSALHAALAAELVADEDVS